MRQRLGLAQDLLNEPKLLVLDEPTNGLDPAGIHELRNHLRTFAAEQNIAVLVSSHLLTEMELMCDRVAIIQNGKLVRIETVRELVDDNKESRVALNVEPLSKAVSYLKSINSGYNPVINDNKIEIIEKLENIPDLVSKLVGHGIKIYEVHMMQQSLEEKFLEMTEVMKLHNMINLIKNEKMKITYRISTWVMIGILVALTITAGCLYKFSGSKSYINDNWKANLTQDNIDYQKQIKEDNLPKGQKTYLQNKIKVNEYRIQHNKKPVADNSLWGFVNNSADLIILFCTSFITGGILFGFKGVSEPFIKYSNGHISEVNMVAHTMGVYGLQCINLVMMVTLAFMISTVFRNSALAVGIGVFLLTVGGTLTAVLAQHFTWPKYILFANTDLSQYLNGTPLIKGMTMSFSIAVITIYFIIFNVISFVGFMKRDVAA